MIYTVTLNPSVDYIVEVNDFVLNELNRIEKEAKYPGGKGINVSRILKRIGVPAKALGFVGGFTGSFIQKELEKEQVETDFIEVDGDSRINIKLKTGKETEINGNGPAISKEQLEILIGKIRTLHEGDILVLAGSIPSSLPASLYEQLIKECRKRGVKAAVDASGKALLNVVKHEPFFIKPNHHELGELFDTEIRSIEDAVLYGKKLAEMGAQHVIVSMAGDGALLLTKEHAYFANVPKGEVINSVGAGDSLVAGFLGTYTQTENVIEAFRFGVATGSATAFSSDLAAKEKIEELLPQVEVQSL
ncbi:1-phosphofructokinase [Ectobacillus panaciterrae]|uniref:1-phosphofructokinase n=1 Tax=Ectobacillus panaciterrae TaxID=363872 RepID=UPI0003F7FE31|nr:1-phosphofructokinase [Ectobacillus panaciterrae]